MEGYNFTQRARKVFLMARENAMRRLHCNVTVEHIALGLLEEGEGVAAAVIQNLAVPIDQVIRDLESHLPPPEGAPIDIELPFTHPAKKVMERSMQEARDLRHSYIGTEHLLLALLHDGGSATARVFAQHGMTKENARVESLRLLGPTPPS